MRLTKISSWVFQGSALPRSSKISVILGTTTTISMAVIAMPTTAMTMG